MAHAVRGLVRAALNRDAPAAPVVTLERMGSRKSMLWGGTLCALALIAALGARVWDDAPDDRSRAAEDETPEEAPMLTGREPRTSLEAEPTVDPGGDAEEGAYLLTVKDYEGNVVEGASVKIEYTVPKIFSRFHLEAMADTTDRTGTVRIDKDDVPATAFDETPKYTLAVTAPASRLDLLNIERREWEQGSSEVAFERALSIEGRVVNVHSEPLAHALVGVVGGRIDKTVRANDEGKFDIGQLRDEVYELAVKVRGFREVSSQRNWKFRGGTQDVVLEVDAGMQVTVNVTNWDPAQRMSATLWVTEYTTGGQEVYRRPWDIRSGSTRIPALRADMSYAFWLATGSLRQDRLCALEPDYRPSHEDVLLTLRPATDTRVRLIYPEGWQGAPRVVFEGRGVETTGALRQRPFAIARDLPEGVYQVTATGDLTKIGDHASVQRKVAGTTEVRAGETVDLKLGFVD